MGTKHKLLLNPARATWESAEAFLAFVKGLYFNPSKNASLVNGVTIGRLKKTFSVRIKRADKTLTISEVTILANEQRITEEELLAVLTKRKILVKNEEGVIINAKSSKPKRVKKPRGERSLQSTKQSDEQAKERNAEL